MSRTIPLSRGLVAIVDDADHEWLNQWKWSARGSTNRYAGRKESGTGRTIVMHRLILAMAHDDPRDADHINGDTLDNRRSNLRPATRSQNQWNRKKVAKNKLAKGVWFNPRHKTYCAVIRKHYKQYHVGCFGELEDAARAYDKAAVEMFGEYARLNFPGEPLWDSFPSKRSVHKTHRRKLSPSQVRELRKLRGQGWTLTKLATKYGISYASVSLISSRKMYADIE